MQMYQLIQTQKFIMPMNKYIYSFKSAWLGLSWNNNWEQYQSAHENK